MTRERDQTDRRLALLVGLVVFAAAVAAASAIWVIVTKPGIHDRTDLTSAVVVTSLILVASMTVTSIRVRATLQGVSWTDAAIMVGFMALPIPWVVVCTGVGVLCAKIIGRVQPLKAVFGASKDLLTAGVAGLVLATAGVETPLDQPLGIVAILAAAHFALAASDELVALPVIAVASRTSLWDRFRSHLDIRLGLLAARFCVVLLSMALLQADGRLLLVVPPLVLCLHLWSSTRVRTRAERSAWQHLAAATDALNEVDLTRVLSSAVSRACELFSADEVEVEIWLRPHRRLVRGTAKSVIFDGPPPDAPHDDMRTVDVPLEGYEGKADIGVLRLRFRGAVQLSEREQYTLHTYSSALCTAVRNASAYAELARASAQHEHAAAHDALTGLPNRRQLLERGMAMLNDAMDGSTALLLIDLNHFKEVNDTLGHAAGDKVLITVAGRLRGAAEADELVCRLGGDEFAILMADLPAPAVAAHRAETFVAALHEIIELDEMRINVEASGGVAIAPSAGGMAELLRRADVAMYQAKRSNQRVAVYSRARDTADVALLTLGGDLPRAVAEHEFTVEFQPIVDLGSGEVIAAEALARWNHPDRGSLGPRRFLDAVERSGLLGAFASAVLDQALMAAIAWQDAGFALPVAVNVSPRSLLDPSFPELVASHLAARRMPADQLILELTENLTLSHLEVVDRVLGQLRDAGVRLALDDFGTGFSSLSVLSRIPVHELKIDRAFVSSMDVSAEATAVVRSTVDLARSLDLVVVAEGVESEPQRHALWELGCSAGQGHLFARPMPAARLLSTLQRGTSGRPGTLAPALHDEGAVIRLPRARRAGGRSRDSRLPHLPA